MLKTTASGFGYLAFASLATQEARAAAAKDNPLAPKDPHFEGKAKRVIFLCMEGAPSHVDTFDYKPKLSSGGGQTFGGARGRFRGRLLASPWKFSQHGQAGLWISELFPEVAKHADDLCVLNSMNTNVPNHPQAFIAMHTGISQSKRPSLGAWVLYGLGTENEDLPGFITLSPPVGNGGPLNYGSAFLPAVYQGTRIGGGRGNASVSNLNNPRLSRTAQRKQLDFLQSLNRTALEREEVQPGIEGLIESYELGFRMQGTMPRLMDVSSEPESVQRLYGLDRQETENFGRQCLLARRFVEAGVRFVEITRGGWDHHRNLKQGMETNCTSIDRPIAGLLTDLKNRGMLKDTLVIWGGEFGRTPYAQGDDGRDHNNKGYTMWMAGGGVKGGLAYGKTDDVGYEAVENPMHIHDWHATILHLLGFDHTKLIYRYAGREMRLTDVKGNVHKGIIA